MIRWYPLKLFVVNTKIYCCEQCSVFHSWVLDLSIIKIMKKLYLYFPSDEIKYDRYFFRDYRPVLKFNYLMLERRMIHPWMKNLTKLKIFLYSHQSSLSTVWWYRKFCADTENDAKRSNRMTNRAKERPGCSRHTVSTFLTLPPPITCFLQDNSP